MESDSANAEARARRRGASKAPPFDFAVALREVFLWIVLFVAAINCLAALAQGKMFAATFAAAIAYAVWPWKSSISQRRFAPLGYDRVTASQWDSIASQFGPAFLRRLPAWEEVRMIPLVDAEDQYEGARGALSLFCWDRDPSHLALLDRGYWAIDRATAAAIMATYPEWSVRQLPEFDWLQVTPEAKSLREFQVGRVLAILEERHHATLPNRDRYLPRA